MVNHLHGDVIVLMDEPILLLQHVVDQTDHVQFLVHVVDLTILVLPVLLLDSQRVHVDDRVVGLVVVNMDELLLVVE